MIERFVVYALIAVIGTSAGLWFDLGLIYTAALDVAAIGAYEAFRAKTIVAAAVGAKKAAGAVIGTAAMPFAVLPSSPPSGYASAGLLVLLAGAVWLFLHRQRRYVVVTTRDARWDWYVIVAGLIGLFTGVFTAGAVLTVPPLTFVHAAAASVALTLCVAVIVIQPQRRTVQEGSTA